jgi:hypothetical protein
MNRRKILLIWNMKRKSTIFQNDLIIIATLVFIKRILTQKYAPNVRKVDLKEQVDNTNNLYNSAEPALSR